MKKYFLVTISIFLLAAACNKQQAQVQTVQDSQTPTAKSEKQPQGTATEETPAWRTYSNVKYGFEFEIPGAWQPVETTKDELIELMRKYSKLPDPKGAANQ